MKKSELKNYIKENILSMLSEDTAGEIEKTKELTAAVKDLEAAKKEAGIEENELDPLPPLSKNFADLSPEGIDMEDNGVRETNLEYRNLIDYTIQNILSSQSPRAKNITTITGTTEERIAQILNSTNS